MEGGNNSREGGNFSLIDIPLEGVNFTWSNSREVELKERLDRFCSLQIRRLSFLLCQRRMSRLLLDHFLIVIEGGSF